MEFLATVNLVLVTVLTHQIHQAIAANRRIEFSKIECISQNEQYAKIKQCDLEILSRKERAVSLRVQPLMGPITDLQGNIRLMKKSNGYKPYLFSTSVNGCKFLKQKYNPLLIYIYNLMKPYSNINHTCPIEHDLVFHQFKVNTDHLDAIAIVPSGDYGFFTDWFVDGKHACTVNFYFTFFEGDQGVKKRDSKPGNKVTLG